MACNNLRDLSLIHISTDEGIVGWGEPVVESRAQTVAKAVEELSRVLIGEDPLRICLLYTSMQRQSRIQDILYDQHMLALNILGKVFQNADNATGIGRAAIAGYHHEIQPHGQIDLCLLYTSRCV